MGELREPKSQRHWIVRDDGAQIHVRSLEPYGTEAHERPALLILDGIGCAGWAFRRLAPQLATTHRVVFIQYRGQGYSPTPPRPWQLGMQEPGSIVKDT